MMEFLFLYRLWAAFDNRKAERKAQRRAGRSLRSLKELEDCLRVRPRRSSASFILAVLLTLALGMGVATLLTRSCATRGVLDQNLPLWLLDGQRTEVPYRSPPDPELIRMRRELDAAKWRGDQAEVDRLTTLIADRTRSSTGP